MSIKFVKQDLWLGLFWKNTCLGENRCARQWVTTYYLCLLPMFPLIWKRYWNEPNSRNYE